MINHFPSAVAGTLPPYPDAKNPICLIYLRAWVPPPHPKQYPQGLCRVQGGLLKQSAPPPCQQPADWRAVGWCWTITDRILSTAQTPQPRARLTVKPLVFQVPILIPCHRVIRSDGAIGNYSGGGQTVKEWLLAHEGIPTGQPASKGLGLIGSWLKPSFESSSPKPSG